MHLVYANRRLLYRTTARSLVATAGAAPCCCGPSSPCCRPSYLEPCDGGGCCNCGSEYLATFTVSHSGAYNFNQINSPRSLVWDASYTMTRRYRCVNGAMVSTIEAFTFSGSAVGVMHDGRSVAVSVSTGDVVPDPLGRTGCPPSILNFLTEDADGAYRVIMDALAVEYVNRHGLVSGTGLAIGLSPDFNGAPVFVPGLHALGYTESCGTFRDVSGWFIGDVGQIAGPGSSHSFSAFANCGQAQYRAVNTWNLAGSPAGTIAGQFTSSVTAAVDIAVLQPCNPDPCTGEPPNPPPPPPPGYGACILRDGTCLVTTAMDCYNRTFFEYRAGENCNGGQPVRMGFGDAFRVILGGGG